MSFICTPYAYNRLPDAVPNQRLTRALHNNIIQPMFVYMPEVGRPQSHRVCPIHDMNLKYDIEIV
jgi:hypothetical protein